MAAVANYLIQSGLCMLLLYLFYLLLLRNFPRPGFNRLYLLLAPLAAFVIPLLELPLPFPQELTLAPALPTLQLPEVTVSVSRPETIARLNSLSLEFILMLVYCAGGLALLARLGIQLFRLRKLIATATPLARYTSEASVLQTSMGYPTFAFLNYIFVSPQSHLTEHERQQVLAHELAHVRLRHTYDVLYYEALTAILWFNPLVWLLKAELRDVHEYQADAEVISEYQPQEYTSLLAKEALFTTGMLVGSHFYKPQVFKRLHMLQKYGQKAGWLRPLLVLPLLLVLLFVFSSRDVSADIAASLSSPAEQVMPEQPQAEMSQNSNNESRAAASEKNESALNPPSTAPSGRETQVTSIASGEKKAGEEVGTTNPETEAEILLPISDPDAQKPFTYVEQMPRFKGGDTELWKFLGKHIRYPKTTQDAGIEGLVVASFVVETDGTLTDITLLKGLHEAADREALRVIDTMSGEWEPGRQNGKTVRVRYTIPIRFQMK